MVEQVDREEERSTRNPIAAIIRHASEYVLDNGGMRSRFSALRLTRGASFGNNLGNPVNCLERNTTFVKFVVGFHSFAGVARGLFDPFGAGEKEPDCPDTSKIVAPSREGQPYIPS